jgi:hypothetical protein
MTQGKYISYKNKSSIFDKIENGELDDEEKNLILDEFERHLNSPYGTLENYYKKNLIESLLKKYSNEIDAREIQQFTRMKISRLLDKIWSLAENNQRINVPPAILQMLLNYASGSENSQADNRVIVENHFTLDNTTVRLVPENKEVTFT